VEEVVAGGVAAGRRVVEVGEAGTEGAQGGPSQGDSVLDATIVGEKNIYRGGRTGQIRRCQAVGEEIGLTGITQICFHVEKRVPGKFRRGAGS